MAGFLLMARREENDDQVKQCMQLVVVGRWAIYEAKKMRKWA